MKLLGLYAVDVTGLDECRYRNYIFLKFRFFWDVAPCSHVEVDRLLEARTASIIRAMKRQSTSMWLHGATSQKTLNLRTWNLTYSSETSVNFNVTTRRYIQEDSKLHTHCHENLKSHLHFLLCSLRTTLRIQAYLYLQKTISRKNRKTLTQQNDSIFKIHISTCLVPNEHAAKSSRSALLKLELLLGA
jgi:hypothetical protein